MKMIKASLLATISLAAGGAHGQTVTPAGETSAVQTQATRGLEEIVVTAQKRAENLQDTPIAISAFTSDSLAKMGVTNVATLAQSSPSLYSAPYPSSSNTVTLYIRGLGVNDPMQITKDGSVGIYLDGFYLSRPQTSTVDLADVERVEILRGPQGTLYGRNTTGGAVNVVSRKPSGEFDLRQQLTLGNRDRVRSMTNVDLPAFGDFAVKFTVLASNHNGWVKNEGGNSYDKEEQLAGRAAVRWTPSDTVTVDYAYDRGRVESTPIYYVNPSLVGVIPGYNANPRKTWRPVDLPESITEFDGHSLTIEWEASDSLTLRSLSGMRDLKFKAYQDYAENFGVGFVTLDDIDSRQYTQEFQAVGSIGNRIEYVAGLFYFREKASHDQVNDIDLLGAGTVANNRQVDALSKSKAAYAQVTWTPAVLEDRLDLTVGARYTDDSRKATRSLTSIFTVAPGISFNARPPEAGISNEQDFSRFNPSFTANYKVTDDVTVYGKVATGYRAGGSNESGLNFTRTFSPEKVTSYEVGLKSDWLDRRLRVNVAGFSMDYKDLQLDTSPVETDRSITDTVNAGKARVNGAEADITLAATDDLTLTASYAYLHQKLSGIRVEAGSEFDPNLSPLAAQLGYTIGQDISGRYVLPFSPKHSVSLSADWTFLRFDNGNLAAHVAYQWKDKAYMTAGAGPDVAGRDFYVLPSRDLLDARLTYTRELANDREIRFALWGRNITDNRYKAHLIGNGDIVQGYFSQSYAIGEPASYGIEISLDF
ncbi:MAG TPA: TonB-dependent receptor [Pedomonas sp.]|uniref:TonB-dependent receptor n=1 Tax=Pedomonas sp. TaxID=2976421 RepID=UPI002F3FBFE7